MNFKIIWKKYYGYILLWFLTGITFSLAVSAMIMSGSSSVFSFYDVGKVYEIPDTVFRTVNIQEGGHQEVSGKVILDKGSYGYGIILSGNKDKWNYFCVQLKETDSIDWKIVYEKHKGAEILSSEGYECKLYSGMNLLPVPDISFNVIGLTAIGENGSSFCVEDMQLREKPPVFDLKKAIVYMFFSMLAFILFSCIFLIIWHRLKVRIEIYSWIKLLQDVYTLIANQFQSFVGHIPFISRYKNCLVTFLFVLMFLYNVWVEMFRIYYTRFKYHIVIYSILILMISILLIEPKLVRKKWNNSLVWNWLILWIITCVSDFLLPKNFRYIGYIMLFIVGFFIFVWNNMEKPDELIKDFVGAVHIFLGLITVFCLTCRPEIEGGIGIRYSGISKNPSIFALYLGTIYAVLLGELDNSIKMGSSFKKKLFLILESCVTLIFCWKSQSLCPLLCIAGVSFIWFVRMVHYTRKQKCRKILISVIVSAIVIMIPTYICIDWGVKHIPQSLGISVIYKGEKPIAKQQYGMVVYAGEIKEKFAESRLGQKLSNTSLSGMLSGRDYYYRAYLREMNLFGHKENPRVWGVKRLPHNAIIGITHRYGIFAGAPYILMLVMVIARTFRYSKRKVSYASLPFYVCLQSIAMSMADNVEQPFVWLPWIGLYLMMGIVFDDERVC